MAEPVTVTIGIIAALVSAISALVSMLMFWREKKSTLSIKLKRGNKLIEVGNLDEQSTRRIIEQLTALSETDDITLEVREGVKNEQ
ncbi:hypothetical protein IQ266_06955 [filamentous cyanobacterium LEGE 11480]|uniref:Uncharacterized protein n=1 Tax=Romeriopsis navalis LEGE 11480 TaxID=2777977 RepID=A0A928VMP5_9CYAN|nr:hypothetical protein [Romeriopsis navalis]MBE9029501.1 hypothetical protein [Romeriopsis navalis LEGE 11480]